MVRQSITYNAVDSQAELLVVLTISFTRCSVQVLSTKYHGLERLNLKLGALESV
jgi:hypothetical protein